MDLRYSSPCFTVSRKTPNSYIKAVILPTRCHAQPKKVIKTFLFSSTATKIYEDKVMGIVGYRDESGKQIYEEFDEGPRLTRGGLEQIKNETELFREVRTRRDTQKDANGRAILSAQYQKMEILNK